MNCAECHGANAEGIYANWKQKLPDGSFPPPPLDGSAHAWHHSRSVLLEVIENGGLALGGKMPAFGAVLNGEEKLAAIAYFQNFWDDETYRQWEVMGGTR
jgi:mono/diheme cytochrome c family protein